MKLIAKLFCLVVLTMTSQTFTISTKFTLLSIITHPFGHPHFGNGHKGVTQSFLSGLNELQVPYNFNPPINQIGEVVWVLSNPSALAEVIELKRIGRIKYILAGPNLVVTANENNKILTSNAIDYVIVPSNEIQTFYRQDEPSLTNHLRTWYAGVDHRYWSPINGSKTNKNTVLIYWKTEPQELCMQIQNILHKYGWKTEIIKYGSYDPEEYKELLDRSHFAVFISRSESQGLALAEAWSMDVPVLAWNPQLWQAKGRESSLISSCPYMNEAVGKPFKTVSDFEHLLQNITTTLSYCQPRQWILDYMTNVISSKLAVDLINSLYK